MWQFSEHKDLRTALILIMGNVVGVFYTHTFHIRLGVGYLVSFYLCSG